MPRSVQEPDSETPLAQEPSPVPDQPDLTSAGIVAPHGRITVAVEPLAESLRRLTGGTGEVPPDVLDSIARCRWLRCQVLNRRSKATCVQILALVREGMAMRPLGDR